MSTENKEESASSRVSFVSMSAEEKLKLIEIFAGADRVKQMSHSWLSCGPVDAIGLMRPFTDLLSDSSDALTQSTLRKYVAVMMDSMKSRFPADPAMRQASTAVNIAVSNAVRSSSARIEEYAHRTVAAERASAKANGFAEAVESWAKESKLRHDGQPDMKLRQPDGGYLRTAETSRLWAALAWSMHSKGHAPHVKSTGPPGAGKTTGAIEFAAWLGLAYIKVDMSGYKETTDMWGMPAPVRQPDGTMEYKFVDSSVTRAYREGYCVIVVDEATRASPDVQNTWLPAMDDTKQVSVPFRGSLIEPGPCTFIFFAVNEGSRHTGTVPLTEAIESRLSIHWEQTTLSLDDYMRIGNVAAGLADAPEAKQRDGISGFMPSGVTASDVEMAAKLCKKLEAKAAQGAVTGAGWFPSPREFKACINLWDCIGSEAVRYTILNRFPNTAFGSGKSPRDQAYDVWMSCMAEGSRP